MKLIRPFLKKPGGPRVTDSELVLFIVCVLVTTVGLAGDIARHVSGDIDPKADFLSGWHLVLYGGVLSVGACIGMGAVRRGPSYVGAVGTGTIGFLMLGFGGVVDAIWHEVFGTEARIEALVSPPHLIVFAGLAFLLTAPIVVLWERSEQRLSWIASIAVEVSMISTVLITMLFTGYLSPLSGGLEFTTGYVEPVIGTDLDEYNQVRGLGMIVWTAAVFSVAHAIILLRFRLKPGLVFLGFCAFAVPPLFLAHGDSIKNFCLGLVAAGAVLELSRVFGRPVLGRATIVVATALSSAVLWTVTFLALDQVNRLMWGTHMWTGAIMISALISAAAAAAVALRIPTSAELGIDPATEARYRTQTVAIIDDDELWIAPDAEL